MFSILFGLIIKPKQKINIHIKSISMLSPIFMGIFNGLQNALLMYLLPIFTASIYFPVSSSLNVCFITIIGVFIFKDKIKITQVIGILLAIAACIIINLVF
jgi:multidrug transporter EmrE-like cation transporter